MNQMVRHTPRWLQSDVFGTSDPRFMWPVSRPHQEMNRLFTDAFRGFDDDAGQRSFQLPEDAIEENISARFADGVLTVTIPRDEKRARAASRRIEVRDAPRAETIQHAAGDRETDVPASGGSERAGKRASEKRPAAGSE